MSYKKARSIPVKAKKEQQQVFLDERLMPLLNQAENNEIEIVYLPAYSPNLNLIERLWKWLRKKCLLNGQKFMTIFTELQRKF